MDWVDVGAFWVFFAGILLSLESPMIGIVKFDRKDLVWTLLFPSAYYHSKIVNDMIVNKKFIFLGTKDGIVRITKKTGFIREYYFPFIGNVNNIDIDRNIIWMGTSNGLLKFKWTREQ